jgi:hypothetical protein
MQAVVDTWAIAASVNLTNLQQNRRAWLGQAACCLEHKCPEDVTREAWNTLSEDVQRSANAVAMQIIEEWDRCRSDQLTLTF